MPKIINSPFHVGGVGINTILWILILIVLFLIFSMFMWPDFWRKVYARQHKDRMEALKRGEEPKKDKAWLGIILTVILGVLLVVVLYGLR